MNKDSFCLRNFEFSIVLYAPMILLAYFFIGDGIQGLQMNTEYMTLISFISVLAPYTTILLILQGTLDTVVGLLTLTYKGKYTPYFFLYTAIWPIVPNAFRLIGNNPDFPPEWDVWAEIAVLSLLSYFARKAIQKRSTTAK